MLATVLSSAVHGIDALLVEVEVDIASGLPQMAVVGLPEGAVKESKDRVRSALKNSGYEFPALTLAKAIETTRVHRVALPRRPEPGTRRSAFAKETRLRSSWMVFATCRKLSLDRCAAGTNRSAEERSVRLTVLGAIWETSGSMQCPQCRADNDTDLRFCESCGARLARLCPGCGHELKPQARFCGKCGAKLVDHSESTVERGGAARLATAVLLLCLTNGAAVSALPDPPVLVQRSTKICQVLGECDRERGGAGTCTNGLRGQPTLNVTESRYGLFGADLGASFEHNGQLFFLFGDTIPSGFHAPPTARPHDTDSIASSADADPEDCVSLQFVTAADGYYLPLQVAIPSGDAAAPVDLGSFETPVGGFSANGSMYVFFTTDAVVTSSAITLGRSVLAKSTDGGRSFTHVYDASTDKFINVAPVVVDNAAAPGLPLSTGQGLLLWASSTAYRKSDPYLAYVPLDSVEDHTRWRYFAGTKSGQPVWSAAESSAVPLFATTPCIGELSVSWNPSLRNWLMLYNCLDPRGINLRAASLPWGPWSSASVIFDPIADKGYCHFIHWSDAVSPTPLGASAPCDSLSDPGANNTFGGEYGPYFISRYTRTDTTSTTLYYLMSTFNPYTAVLMKAALRTSCAPAPLAGCRKPAAAASTVQLKRNAKISKNAVTWTWNRGAATALADFGDPTTHTGYGLCVYDSTPALVVSLSAPAGGTCAGKACWTSTKAGFKYTNKDATPDGLFQLQLMPGAADKAKIVAKGKGPNLAMPAFPLLQDPTIVVQVQNIDGGCWEAAYSAPAKKNDGTQFNDKSD